MGKFEDQAAMILREAMGAMSRAGIGRRNRIKAATAVIAEALIENERRKCPTIETVDDLLKYRFTLRRPGSVIGWGVDRPWKGRRKRLLRRWISKIQYVDKPSQFGNPMASLGTGQERLIPGVKGLLVYLTYGTRTTCAFIPEGEFERKTP